VGDIEKWYIHMKVSVHHLQLGDDQNSYEYIYIYICVAL